MTIPNGPRLQAARALVARFGHGSTPPAGAKPGAAHQAVAAAQRSPAGWPVSRAELATQLTRRLDGKDQPRQLETSYCGPAAFLYCLLHDRPDVFVDYAIGLWTNGSYRFGTPAHKQLLDAKGGQQSLGEIHAERAANKDPRVEFISDLDWMTMSALSASTRPMGWAMGRPRDADLGASITYPQVMKDWFAATGAPLRHSTMGIGLEPSSVENSIELMGYWSSGWIVLQIDASLVVDKDQPSTIGFWSNRHWVLLSPLQQPLVRQDAHGPWLTMADALKLYRSEEKRLDNTRVDKLATERKPRDWETRLSFVSWGKETQPVHDPKLGYLERRIYGGYAFGHMP